MPNNNTLPTASALEHRDSPQADPGTDHSSPYEFRSGEVQEIMTKMPSWIIRQGTTVLFAVMVMLFALAYRIRFPDVVTTRVHISAAAPVQGVGPSANSAGYLVTGGLPLEDVGKVTAGQQVLIRLPQYPSEQFGMIEGKVESVLAGQSDTAYTLNIRLTNGLITQTRKRITTGLPLYGTAEVLTSNKTILERLFETVRAK